jgi:hypothetical protein
MKTNKWASIILVFVIMAMWVSCNNPMNSTDNLYIPLTPVDSTFWFGTIYDELIDRIGNVRVDDDGTFVDKTTGIDMGQVANTEYVCNAISPKKGTNFQPVAGTETQAANCEYLLKMIDKTNNNSTSYGISSYATEQVVDIVAVTQVLEKIIMFEPKSWTTAGTTAGTYQVELPAGTYKLTAVSGKGGNDGEVHRPGSIGNNGTKITAIFTITSTVTVSVVVGGNGGDGGEGRRFGTGLPSAGGYGGPLGGGPGSGGLSGGGGTFGIIGYYYAVGGNGGAGAQGDGGGMFGGGDGGTGGAGGTLSGTAVSGTPTTESPYVTLELN